MAINIRLGGRLNLSYLKREQTLSFFLDYQQTTKKKGTILRLSLSNLKVLEVYIKMNSIYIPTILVYMIANCNTYSHFIHRLIHTEKTSKYLFKKAGWTAKFPPHSQHQQR